MKTARITVLFCALLCASLILAPLNSTASAQQPLAAAQGGLFQRGIPSKPTLLSPANGTITNDASPVLSWSVVPGATSYSITIYWPNGNVYVSGPVGSSTSYHVTCGQGTYSWKVAAVDSMGGMSSYTDLWYFTVYSTNTYYPISGNAGAGGTSLSYTGSSNPVVAVTDGSYTIAVLSGWTGSITPSKTGVSYSPASRSYTNVTAAQANQDYSAFVTISGNAGTSGATITYTGGSTTADGSGAYSFTVARGWSGTVTPSKTGYTFSPSSKSYTNVSASSSQNFTATLITYTISGNAEQADATVTYTGGSTTTDGSNNYTFTVPYGWTGSVAVSKAGYVFEPRSRSYTNVTANETNQGYTSTAAYAISGSAELEGVTLSYEDSGIQTATTGSGGNYSFNVPVGWSGTVTPSKTGYLFDPENIPYTSISGDQEGQDYEARVTISGDAGVGGAALDYTGGSTTADGSGNYSFTVPYEWIGTVTPSKAGYTFDPAQHEYTTPVTENKSAQDFTALVSLTGNVDIGEVTMNYTGGSISADSSGDYTITVAYGWSGTVTPSKAGYRFSPSSLSYENLAEGRSGQDYEATAIHTISGAAGVGGASLQYEDNGTQTATADGNGDYSFTVPEGWAGRLTPSKAGYSFEPSYWDFPGVTDDQVQDFTATLITYAISGNAGTGNTILTYDGGSATADGSGNYTFTVPYDWSGTVIPSKGGYFFTPASRTYANVKANQPGQNYIARIRTTFKSAGGNDGWVLESGENSGLGGGLDASSTMLRIGDDATRKQYRSILSFNTGGLPDNAIITKITLKVKKQGITGGGNPLTAFQGFKVDVKNGMFGTSALQAADFQAAASKAVGPILPTPVSGWYSLNLTSAKTYINKLSASGGLTQLRLRFTLDDDNNAAANYLSLYSGNVLVTADRPQLIIEYYLP